MRAVSIANDASDKRFIASLRNEQEEARHLAGGRASSSGKEACLSNKLSALPRSENRHPPGALASDTRAFVPELEGT